MVDRRDTREDIAKLQILTDVMTKQMEKERQVLDLLKQNVETMFDKLDDRLRVVERNMYIAFGALVALQFILKFVRP